MIVTSFSIVSIKSIFKCSKKTATPGKKWKVSALWMNSNSNFLKWSIGNKRVLSWLRIWVLAIWISSKHLWVWIVDKRVGSILSRVWPVLIGFGRVLNSIKIGRVYCLVGTSRSISLLSVLSNHLMISKIGYQLIGKTTNVTKIP